MFEKLKHVDDIFFPNEFKAINQSNYYYPAVSLLPAASKYRWFRQENQDELNIEGGGVTGDVYGDVFLVSSAVLQRLQISVKSCRLETETWPKCFM